MTSGGDDLSVSGIVPRTTRWRRAGGRHVVPLICLTLLGLFCILYRAAPDLYARLLTGLMLIPFRSPFMDWAFVPSAIECWNRGVDVYVDNTCYDLLPHLVFAYSPFWLRATFLSADKAWVNPVGLFLAISFFLSLGTLPPLRRRAETWVMLLAAGSSLTAFAVERGNVDLIMFLMTMLGIRLWSGSLRGRLGAYGVFAAAGFLKFYPFILLALVARERLRIAVPVIATFLLGLAVFVWTFHGELIEISRVIPVGSHFGAFFGAVNLPYGLAELASRLPVGVGVPAPALLGRICLVVLVAAAAFLAWWLCERRGVRRELSALPPGEAGYLLAGALLVCGCFFTGQSAGYRGIFLLLVIPGLLRLSLTHRDPAMRRMLFRTALATVFVMWVMTIDFCIVALGLGDPSGDGGAVGMAHWLLHEAAWWWIVSVLLSTILGFLLETTAWREGLAIIDRVAGKH